ncbi:chromosome transmission fidelity protein 18 homolog isoform X2 [Leptopilina heterotoma]|uniref:chromosome transmission fidelity protein 18 homolog isoform X2 n=1 Tax=Leptopilina heterotoma TaxID=63436 RepID=UPI001CA819A6|nr:chromosome transmission fidelity protein 18 homolog isoform X2 [Leptopilina heterotoma]
MDEFPDPDEEFDLAHEDEFELLNELEDFEGPPSKKISNKSSVQPNLLASSTQIDHQKSTNLPTVQKIVNPDLAVENGLSQNTCQPTDSISFSKFTQETPTNYKQDLSKTKNNNSDSRAFDSTSREEIKKLNDKRKRTVDELVEDVNALLSGENLEISYLHEPEIIEQTSKRPRWNDYEEVRKLILQERKIYNSRDSTGLSSNNRLVQSLSPKKDTISTRPPRWNFIKMTRNTDGQSLYVRVKNDEKGVFVKAQPTTRLLSVSYSQLKAQAEEIIIKNIEYATLPQSVQISNENSDDSLWVDKYKPKKYLELLSDENINRKFLHWLKLWDKIVFHREPVKTKRISLSETNKKFGRKNFNNEESVEEFDSKGYPFYRIALLSGPPGLGKTTLAHVAAKHAGYNVIEMNASDDREPSAFREALLSSTQMQAVIGANPRPNCLILDEIDGAPSASIDLLIKFVQGKLVQKGKKNKQTIEKMKLGCQRPVICICNDLYAPALRQLKAMALVIPVPAIEPTRLADRLMEISRKEHLKVEYTHLIKLSERSGCDIRTCLGALQYMRGSNIKENLSLGLKDTRKGLFDSWKILLQVPMTQKGFFPPKERISLILKTVNQGDSERLCQGMFHNYPTICKEKMESVARSLEWFEFFDEITKTVAARQVWTVMPYTNYAFVIWHFDLASQQSSKLSYPLTVSEVNQKLTRNRAILTTSQKSCRIDKLTLTLDISPLLPELLAPRLRSVSAHLYSSKEKAELMHLVNVMLDYGLTLIQEKKPEGGFEYNLEPDLLQIGTFPDCKFRRGLSYAVKQIVIQELEVERVKRAAALVNSASNKQEKQKRVDVTQEFEKNDEKDDCELKSAMPNNMKQTLEPVEVKPITGEKQRDEKRLKRSGGHKIALGKF